jgi:hypothetical protein
MLGAFSFYYTSRTYGNGDLLVDHDGDDDGFEEYVYKSATGIRDCQVIIDVVLDLLYSK